MIKKEEPPPVMEEEEEHIPRDDPEYHAKRYDELLEKYKIK